MRIILFIALILSIIFAKWVGIATSWLISPIASNIYGSILIVFALIYLIFEVTGLNRKTLQNMHMPQIKKDKGGKSK